MLPIATLLQYTLNFHIIPVYSWDWFVLLTNEWMTQRITILGFHFSVIVVYVGGEICSWLMDNLLFNIYWPNGNSATSALSNSNKCKQSDDKQKSLKVQGGKVSGSLWLINYRYVCLEMPECYKTVLKCMELRYIQNKTKSFAINLTELDIFLLSHHETKQKNAWNL